MITEDKENRTVSLLDKSGIWITVSDVDYKLYGLDVSHLVQDNRVKMFWKGKWGYLLEHWAREDENAGT